MAGRGEREGRERGGRGEEEGRERGGRERIQRE